MVSTKFLLWNAELRISFVIWKDLSAVSILVEDLPPKVHSSAVVSLFHYFLHTLVDLCGSSHLRVNSPLPQLRHFFLVLLFLFLPFWNSSSVPLYCPRPMKHFPVRVFQSFFSPFFIFTVCCYLIYSLVKRLTWAFLCTKYIKLWLN